jgi:tRNA A37 threonylcarbamoyladenosine dehydratase
VTKPPCRHPNVAPAASGTSAAFCCKGCPDCAGGVGSLLVEYLARLGVESLIAIDSDRIDSTNLSRVVGAIRQDVIGPEGPLLKIDITKRVALQANPDITFLGIRDDFAHEMVAHQVLDCDFLFLAADSMRARLVFNAVAQQ